MIERKGECCINIYNENQSVDDVLSGIKIYLLNLESEYKNAINAEKEKNNIFEFRLKNYERYQGVSFVLIDENKQEIQYDNYKRIETKILLGLNGLRDIYKFPTDLSFEIVFPIYNLEHDIRCKIIGIDSTGDKIYESSYKILTRDSYMCLIFKKDLTDNI